MTVVTAYTGPGEPAWVQRGGGGSHVSAHEFRIQVAAPVRSQCRWGSSARHTAATAISMSNLLIRNGKSLLISLGCPYTATHISDQATFRHGESRDPTSGRRSPSGIVPIALSISEMILLSNPFHSFHPIHLLVHRSRDLSATHNSGPCCRACRHADSFTPQIQVRRAAASSSSESPGTALGPCPHS